MWKCHTCCSAHFIQLYWPDIPTLNSSCSGTINGIHIAVIAHTLKQYIEEWIKHIANTSGFILSHDINENDHLGNEPSDCSHFLSPNSSSQTDKWIHTQIKWINNSNSNNNNSTHSSNMPLNDRTNHNNINDDFIFETSQRCNSMTITIKNKK